MIPRASETLVRFPYREGLAFSVDLYRAGGFALIDEAYRRPPVVTEHILHPQKYLADEQPRAIGELLPPPNWTVALSTPLGELRTRVFLEPCLGQKVAVAAASGWNGDRAFVLERDSGWMLGWVSAWDSEADAAELEDGLARMGRCLPANEAGDKAIRSQFSIRREGSVVAFARGGEQADRSLVLDRLLPLPGQAPAARPVSTRKIPPLQKPPEPQGGSFEADVYRNEFFGITAGAPPLFEHGTWTPKGTALKLPKFHARKTWAGGSMGYSIHLTTPDRIERAFSDWEERLIKSNAERGYETTRYKPQKEIATNLGPAFERSWTERRGNLVRRVTIIPICGGTGTIELQTHFSTVPGREFADYWVQSFSWTDPKKRPPVCEYLDPESVDPRSVVTFGRTSNESPTK